MGAGGGRRLEAQLQGQCHQHEEVRVREGHQVVDESPGDDVLPVHHQRQQRKTRDAQCGVGRRRRLAAKARGKADRHAARKDQVDQPEHPALVMQEKDERMRVGPTQKGEELQRARNQGTTDAVRGIRDDGTGAQRAARLIRKHVGDGTKHQGQNRAKPIANDLRTRGLPAAQAGDRVEHNQDREHLGVRLVQTHRADEKCRGDTGPTPTRQAPQRHDGERGTQQCQHVDVDHRGVRRVAGREGDACRDGAAGKRHERAVANPKEAHREPQRQRKPQQGKHAQQEGGVDVAPQHPDGHLHEPADANLMGKVNVRIDDERVMREGRRTHAVAMSDQAKDEGRDKTPNKNGVEGGQLEQLPAPDAVGCLLGT